MRLEQDGALTHGLAGALVHAKDDNDVPLGTYLPNKEEMHPEKKPNPTLISFARETRYKRMTAT